MAFIPRLGIAAEPKKADEEVVQLPAFLVEEPGLAKPEPHWYYAELPGIVLLSCLSERATKAFLNEIPGQLILYSWLLPRELQPSGPESSVVILDDRRLSSLRLPLSSVKMPEAKGGGRRLGGGFARWDFAATYYQSRRATPEVGAFMVGMAAYAQLAQRAGWFHVGEIIAQGAMNATATREGVSIYQPAHTLTEKKLPLPSLAILFAEPAPPSGSAPVSASLRELRTWFGRWALFAEEGRHQEAWWNFARGTATGPALNDEIARRYFGMSLSDLDAKVGQFRKTSQSQRGRRLQLKLKPGTAMLPPPTAPLALLRDATETEIARLLTQWTLLAWRNDPDLRVPLRDAARRILARARKSAPDDPQLTALRGLVELMDGNVAEARPLLESVAASPDLNRSARFELAKLRQIEAVAEAAAAPAKFTPAQVRAIVGPLTPFLHSTPNQVDALMIVVETWQRAAEAPSREEILRLVAGVRLFPHHEELVRETVKLCLALRLFPEARELAAMGLAAAKTEADRTALRSLIERIQSEAP